MENNRRYFKSLEELSHPEAAAPKEFLPETPGKNVVEESDFDLKSSRRDFLKFMGFGISAATLAACTKTPVKKAIPYVVKPAEIDPGVANYYASYYPDGEFGVLVKTREGRPIKIDGNDLCPISGGGSSAMAQASVLSLYDDGRLQNPMADGAPSDWTAVDKAIFMGLRGITNEGGQIAILSGTINSPSTLRAIDAFKEKHPTTRHIMYDAVSYYGIRKAHQMVFEKAVIPSMNFAKAETIVSFSADFLGTWLSPVEFAKAYASKRDVIMTGKMSYHVQFETNMSLAGSKADLRIPVKPSEQGAAMVALYNALAKKAGVATVSNPGFDQLNNYVSEKKINHIAEELWKTKGKSLVVNGSNDVNQQVLCIEINRLLGNYGKTIDTDKPSMVKLGNDEQMENLVADMNAGKIKALIIYGSNPSYTYHDAAAFNNGLSQVGLSISLNSRLDETSMLTKYVCPDSHYLESWNDHNPKYGVYHISQPTISTIFSTRQAQQSLLNWSVGGVEYYNFIRSTWSSTISAYQNKYVRFENFWKNSVHDGVFMANMELKREALPLVTTEEITSDVMESTDAASSTEMTVEESTTVERVGLLTAARELVHGETTIRDGVHDVLHGREVVTSDTTMAMTTDAIEQSHEEEAIEVEQTNATYSGPIADVSGIAATLIKQLGTTQGLEIVLYEKVGVMDGRDGNNPWLHEMPDSISKVSWDNYLCVATADAKAVNLVDGSLVTLTVGDKKIEQIPILLMPGQKIGTASIAVGYGHKMHDTAGKVANTVGINVFSLINSDKTYQYAVSGGHIDGKVNGEIYPLAKTQIHHHIQIPSSPTRKDDIVKETTLDHLLVFRKGEHDSAAHEEHGHGHAASNGKVYDGMEPGKLKDLSLYPDWRDRNFYKAIKWGLTVNLNTCTGCNACVIACQSENNVSVVGKLEVMRRREMHWIRIDRYFATNRSAAEETADSILDTENPTVMFQPLMCQHCENAPCENVCPVNAINHSSEGINQQIYNRCMGTRYCANNCPFKVRRFNWFAYYDNDKFDYHMNSDLGRMVLNPDVTVRARGVMEKCSFCMQRIQAAKLKAKTENRALVDGDVKSACQDACPTGAITFGNMNDPESKVSKIIHSDLSYRLVELLNTLNSVYYTTQIRNIKMEDETMVSSTSEQTEAHH